MDHLAADVEHLERLNELIRTARIGSAAKDAPEKMRAVHALIITPSTDLSKLAAQHQKDTRYLLSYFMSGLSRDAASCADLMSYLLFTPRYTNALIDIGYHNANRRIDGIEDFLFSAQKPAKSRAS